MSGTDLAGLRAEVAACAVCAPHLPLGPRPVLQVGAGARLLIAGQAPGRVVHRRGVPFDDRTGDALRAWLGIDRATFYDPERVAILPLGFCYPGRGRGGDRPPRPECAPLWQARLLARMPAIPPDPPARPPRPAPSSGRPVQAQPDPDGARISRLSAEPFPVAPPLPAQPPLVPSPSLVRGRRPPGARDRSAASARLRGRFAARQRRLVSKS